MKVTIDNRSIEGEKGETILQAARRAGISSPMSFAYHSNSHAMPRFFLPGDSSGPQGIYTRSG